MAGTGPLGPGREAALELIKCQRLIKGYGDTFARGLGNYERIVARYHAGGGSAATIRTLRDAARG
jgi:indolepyruvate ferredoxin oxidoreductase beta subunit